MTSDRHRTPPFALPLDRVRPASGVLIAPMRKNPEAPLQVALLFQFENERPLAVCLESAQAAFALVNDVLEMAKHVWPDETSAMLRAAFGPAVPSPKVPPQ